MKRLNYSIIMLIALMSSSTISAQALSSANNTQTGFSDFVTSSFINYFSRGGVQEKLYLATDKPYYSAGDTIYFSAFLVNSIYFNNTTDTNFIYVDLIDGIGNIVSQLRVKGTGGRFHNAIPISTRITPGKYTLRAYSKWQTNFDNALFFSKQIEIGNYIDDAIHTNITYELDKSGRVVASVEVTNAQFAPIPDNQVEYSLNINGRTTNHITQTDNNGIFRFSFRPSTADSDRIRLHISANGRKLDRKIQLPSFEEDFSVKFMPEGGNLIAGIEQIIAFKAVGIDGHYVDVKGVIRTKTGEEICTIASTHNGMGKFKLTAQVGEPYIATLSTKNGVSRSFTLPIAIESGCVVSVTPHDNNRLLLQVKSTPDYPVNRLAAIVQSRGVVNFVVEDLSHPMRIPLDKLRSGIAQVSIVDKALHKVIAERLFFVRGKYATANITTNVKRFAPREQVMIDLGIKSSSGEAVKGDFVVSVVDASLINKSENEDNIFSYMLLNSDLKGHIENPTYYFEANDEVHNEHLDLIMLTHGWRRYRVDDIITGKRPKIRYPFEVEQFISGSVAEAIGKTRNVSVMIFRNRKEYLGVHPLNKTNRFHITGVDSQDTTTYTLQALNREGSSSRVRIKVDPYTHPITPIIPRPIINREQKQSLTEEYMVRSKQSYFEDGGMPIIDIDAVEIIAKKNDTYDYSSSLNDFNTVSGDMTRFSSIFDALQRFRELEIIGTNVYINSPRLFASPVTETNPSGGNTSSSEEANEGADVPDTTVEVDMDDKEELMPALYVNGQQMDINVVDAYPMSEVLSVSYLNKFESMAAGMGSETGAIILHVRDINAREKFLINSMAEVIVPGYAAPIEFYAPDYSVSNDKNKRDNRTTIAWIPSLQSNSLGDAAISFWTADRASDYRLVIEGITSEGELLHNEFILQSK